MIHSVLLHRIEQAGDQITAYALLQDRVAVIRIVCRRPICQAASCRYPVSRGLNRLGNTPTDAGGRRWRLIWRKSGDPTCGLGLDHSFSESPTAERQQSNVRRSSSQACSEGALLFLIGWPTRPLYSYYTKALVLINLSWRHALKACVAHGPTASCRRCGRAKKLSIVV